MRWQFLVLGTTLTGCGAGPLDLGDDKTDTTPDDSAPGDSAPDDSGPDDSGTPTETTGGDCPVDASLVVSSVEATEVDGLALARTLDVTLSGAAVLGVACTNTAIPTDTLYWQTAAGTTHTVDLLGFAPETTYDCRVAPVCPRSAAEPTSVTVAIGDAPRDVQVLEVDEHATLTPADPSLLLINSGPCSGDGDPFLAMYDLEGKLR